jgi:hypothetical protein
VVYLHVWIGTCYECRKKAKYMTHWIVRILHHIKQFAQKIIALCLFTSISGT